jgi:hypothetical protein
VSSLFTIWKFPLPTDTDDFTIALPWRIHLSLQVQNDVPCLWGAVTSNEKDPRPVRFIWVGTGQPIPDVVKAYYQSFRGTVQLANGLVLHLFEVVP